MIKFLIESQSNPDERYAVFAKRLDGDYIAWQCPCKSHKYRGICRHVLLAQQCFNDGLKEMVQISKM